MVDKAQKIEVIDNPSVAEIYANKLIAASFDGGAVVITLGTTRFVPQKNTEASKDGGPPPVHVTARLAVSPAGAVELANALGSMLRKLSEIQKQAVPTEPAKPKSKLS